MKKTEYCLYCGIPVAESEIVPDFEDDDAWDKVSEQHYFGCKWARTKALRVQE